MKEGATLKIFNAVDKKSTGLGRSLCCEHPSLHTFVWALAEEELAVLTLVSGCAA